MIKNMENFMWKMKNYDKNKEIEISNKGVHRIISRLICSRNIELMNIDKFLSSEYNDLSDPYLLNDVEKGVNIFIETIKTKGSVAIIGDYDADGIISSTMLKELCNNFKLKCKVFLPSRIEHGYGLSKNTIESFIDENKIPPDLLFITDCGTNNYKEIEILREYGIKKIIIIDHHEIMDRNKLSLNADALISWHLSNGFNEMCACGEVFQFIRGIRYKTNKINPIEFLTYACIGSVADVSPVVGDNRIIIKNGLTEYAINHIRGYGLRALLEQSNVHVNSLTQEDISFKIAPKINAIGRIYKPDAIYHLLIERDVQNALEIMEHIIDYNDKRKKIQHEIEIEAKKIIKENYQEYKYGILCFNEKWHIGVVGIVASKIVEFCDCPALVIGHSNGVWKGSGRSINGVNIKEILDSCSDLFISYGGHAGAVGATIKNELINDAPKIFNEACEKYFKTHSISKDIIKYFDATIKPSAINMEIGEKIIEMSPWCQYNNPEPIFKLSDVKIVNSKFIEKETWKLLKFYVEKNGVKSEFMFKTFSPVCGAEIEGRIADIYFKFPQKTKDPSNKFFSYEMNMVDMELKD
jgi:single-stranded-DNA-specific exonuclease